MVDCFKGGRSAYYANWQGRWQWLRFALAWPAAWEISGARPGGSAFFPEGRQQEYEETVDLESSQEHAECQSDLSDGMDEGVVFDRAYISESRTDRVERAQ